MMALRTLLTGSTSNSSSLMNDINSIVINFGENSEVSFYDPVDKSNSMMKMSISSFELMKSSIYTTIINKPSLKFDIADLKTTIGYTPLQLMAGSKSLFQSGKIQFVENGRFMQAHDYPNESSLSSITAIFEPKIKIADIYFGFYKTKDELICKSFDINDKNVMIMNPTPLMYTEFKNKFPMFRASKALSFSTNNVRNGLEITYPIKINSVRFEGSNDIFFSYGRGIQTNHYFTIEGSSSYIYNLHLNKVEYNLDNISKKFHININDFLSVMNLSSLSDFLILSGKEFSTPSIEEIPLDPDSSLTWMDRVINKDKFKLSNELDAVLADSRSFITLLANEEILVVDGYVISKNDIESNNNNSDTIKLDTKSRSTSVIVNSLDLDRFLTDYLTSNENTKVIRYIKRIPSNSTFSVQYY